MSPPPHTHNSTFFFFPPQNQNQKQQNKTWCPFCVGQLFLILWPALNYDWSTHSLFWRTLIFPLPEAINCEELLDEGCDFVPTSLCCDFVRFEFVQVLCMQSRSQWVPLGFSPSVSEKCYFFRVTNLCRLLIFFCTLSHKDIRALNGRALMKTTHLPLSLSLSSCFQLWVSVLTTVYCKKKLLW